MAGEKKEKSPATASEARRIAEVCRSLVETIPDAIYVLDQQGRYLYANPHYLERLGVSADDIKRKSYADYHARKEAEKFARDLAEVFKTGEPLQRLHHSDRDGHDFLQTLSPVKGEKAGKNVVVAVSVFSRNVTEWKLAEHLYQTLAEKSPIGLFIVQDQRFVWFNRRFQSNTGYTAKDILGADSLFMVHRDDREHVRQSARAMMRGESVAPYEYRVVTKQGDILWYMGTVTPFEYKFRRATLGSQMDISLQKRAEDALKQSEERSRSIVDNIADAYYEVDLRGNLLIFNDAYLQLFGYRRAEMLGLNYKRYVDKKHAEIARRAFSQVYKKGAPLNKLDWEILTKDGLTKQVELSVTRVSDAQGKPAGFRGIISDVTMRRQQEEIMRLHAFHDPLTGLANRILFYDRLNMAIKRAARSHKLVGVLMIDLDYFKNVNDQWGHAAGDLLLQEVAERLLSIVRDTDTVARPGGDEFCVALPSLNSQADIVRICEKIIEIFQRPFHLDTQDTTITASVGAALYPAHGSDFDTLYQKADKAMYLAKNMGRARYCFYEEPTARKKKGRPS